LFQQQQASNITGGIAMRHAESTRFREPKSSIGFPESPNKSLASGGIHFARNCCISETAFSDPLDYYCLRNWIAMAVAFEFKSAFGMHKKVGEAP
jgi:hypothetical protein